MWYYRGKEFLLDVSDYDSFIYIITRLSDHTNIPKYYIGKKTFWFTERKRVAGKKNREVLKRESDWVDYFGSSEWLNEVIEQEGKEMFRREILHLCKSKGESFILEAKEQMQNNVLSKHFENGVKKFFNKQILGKYKKEYFSEDELEELQSSHNALNATGMIYITDGTNNKRISIDDEIPNGWQVGNGYRQNYSWVNNGKEERVVPRLEVNSLEYRDWNLGRLYSATKNKICVHRLDTIKYISESELPAYEQHGWAKGNNKYQTLAERNKVYVCCNETKSQKLILRDEVSTFLEQNKNWELGQFRRGNFGTENKVFAVDMTTGKKVQVTKEEYKNDKNLSSVKTTKVKVKKNNRIVFTGYLPKFFMEFDVPEIPFRRALRNKDEFVVVKKGKNVYLTNEKWSITKI